MKKTSRAKTAQPDVSRTDWVASMLLTKAVVARGRRLVVMTSADGKAVAVESSADADSAEAIFGEHSHKVIGAYGSLQKALTACDSYAEAWLKGFKSTKSKSCACDEIKPSRKRVA